MDNKNFYPAGQPLCQWLYTEPAAVDVSSLYDNNYTVPTAPYQIYWKQALHGAETLTPMESGRETVLGQSVQWRRLRLADGDVKPTWAVFGTHATLLLNYAFCELTAAKAGQTHFEINCTGAVSVLLNGSCCIEDFCFQRVGSRMLEFTADLKKGRNTLLLILMNVHLHSVNSFSMKASDTDLKITLPLAECQNRPMLERDFDKFYLKDTVIAGDVTVYTDSPLESAGLFLFSILQSGTVISGVEFLPTGDHPVCFSIPESEILPAGTEYTLAVGYRDDTENAVIQGPTFRFERISYHTPPKAAFPARKEYLRQTYGTLTETQDLQTLYRPLYACLARLVCDQPLNPEELEKGLSYLNARYDCADFGMHALVRMVYGYPNAIPPGMMKLVKDCILQFKYHEDDGGRSMMFCRSENHRILFASLEYLAGKLYPHERFSQSGQTGNFHQERGRRLVEQWIREKGSYGFMEWHSNTYYEEDMLAMLNLYDFAAEYDNIRTRARSLMDWIGYLLASHTSHGILATTHGRCYEKNLLYPLTEPIADSTWLLLGTSNLLQKRISPGALFLIDSRYTPPINLESIAAAESLETRSRMGLYFQRGMDGADCYTYRCQRYQLSALMEYRPGSYGQQIHAGQILIEGSIPVFCSSFENASPNTRPSYWGGQYRMPRTAASSHTLAYLYQIDTPVGLSHCYFPIPLFDETDQRGNWMFGRKADTYIGVYSQNGFTVTQTGRFKDKELTCDAKTNLWLFQMGTVEAFTSYSKFINAVTAAEPVKYPDSIRYQSPTCGTMLYRFDGPCTQNSAPVLDGHYPLIDNPYLHSGYGSGILETGESLLNFRD